MGFPNNHYQLIKHLYEKYFEIVYTMAFRFSQNDATKAEDLTQSFYLKLCLMDYGRIMVYRENLAGFIKIAAYNFCVSDYHKQRKARMVNIVYMEEPPASIVEPFDPAYKEQEGIIFKQFDQLPGTQKLALELRMEGYSYQEIAEILDTNTKSVSNLLNRARKKLRNRLLPGNDSIPI